MKFLASYSGELSNAAFFFSSFGNVNETNKHITNGSLGPEPENTWHPWVYAKRLEVVEGVKQLKEKLLDFMRERIKAGIRTFNWSIC